MSLSSGSGDGIARILAGPEGSTHSGMGIVVTRRHVVTCAHVLNHALGRTDRYDNDCPDASQRFRVVFPLSQSEHAISARVVRWSKPGLHAGDCALLELEQDVPEDVHLAILADVRGSSVSDDALSVFGMKQNQILGTHFDAAFNGRVGGGWTQIVGIRQTGLFAEGGFSGAAIWNKRRKSVVGMLVAVKASTDDRIAYAIPVGTLKSEIPNLPVEDRLASSDTQQYFLVSALFLFFALFLHHLETTSSVWHIPLLPWAENSEFLAAVFGGHIFALFAPVSLGLMYLHARSMAQRPWFQQVPSLTSRFPEGCMANTRIGACTTLLFVAVLPIIMQVHFLQTVFDRENKVLIYADEFSDDKQRLMKDQDCIRGTTRCTHADAGFMSLVRADDGTFPFWNNKYHLADPLTKKSVSFWPILQPIILLFLTALAIAIAALAGHHMFLTRRGELVSQQDGRLAIFKWLFRRES